MSNISDYKSKAVDICTDTSLALPYDIDQVEGETLEGLTNEILSVYLVMSDGAERLDLLLDKIQERIASDAKETT